MFFINVLLFLLAPILITVVGFFKYKEFVFVICNSVFILLTLLYLLTNAPDMNILNYLMFNIITLVITTIIASFCDNVSIVAMDIIIIIILVITSILVLIL